MPIQFSCTNCDKTLRVKDESAGKRAKCPACGTVLQIPAASAAASPALAPAPPQPAAQPAGGESNFPDFDQPSGAASSGNEFDFDSPSPRAPANDNPFASPTAVDTSRAGQGTSAQQGGVSWILFSFEGRIPRRVYWGASILTAIVFNILFYGLLFALPPDLAGIAYLILLPNLWISLAITCKRWHDRDKSGWWTLVAFVPIIGGIWIFIECGCLRGTVGPNQYGPDPT